MRKYEWNRDYKVISRGSCKGCVLTAIKCDHSPSCDYTKFFVSRDIADCGRTKNEACFTQESIADRELELLDKEEIVTGFLSVSDGI